MNYDDRDQEVLYLIKESRKFQNFDGNSTELRVISNEPSMLKPMADHFCKKHFLRHQAQVFEQYSLNNSFQEEELEFLKTVKLLPLSKLPKNVNIINSHVL